MSTAPTIFCEHCSRPIVPGTSYVLVNTPTKLNAPIHLGCLAGVPMSIPKPERLLRAVDDAPEEP